MTDYERGTEYFFPFFFFEIEKIEASRTIDELYFFRVFEFLWYSVVVIGYKLLRLLTVIHIRLLTVIILSILIRLTGIGLIFY